VLLQAATGGSKARSAGGSKRRAADACARSQPTAVLHINASQQARAAEHHVTPARCGAPAPAAAAARTHLRLGSCMVYQGLGICCQAAHGAAHVLIDLRHLLYAAGLLRWRQAGAHAGRELRDHGPEARCCCCAAAAQRDLPMRRAPPTNRGEVMRFSTASTMPSFVRMPIAVEPSCRGDQHDVRSKSWTAWPQGAPRPPPTAP